MPFMVFTSLCVSEFVAFVRQNHELQSWRALQTRARVRWLAPHLSEPIAVQDVRWRGRGWQLVCTAVAITIDCALDGRFPHTSCVWCYKGCGITCLAPLSLTRTQLAPPRTFCDCHHAHIYLCDGPQASQGPERHTRCCRHLRARRTARRAAVGGNGGGAGV